MTRYAQHIQSKVTPQSEPIPGRESEQVENSAGGYVFPVDDWVRLDRFLVLGAEGGSYYASEHKLTKENAGAVLRCIKSDGARTVKRIVEISQAGRAPKNDPAIFALAMACTYGDEPTRKEAYAALPKVCRIGTHLFQFAESVQPLRGWGRGLRSAVARWYLSKEPKEVAFQAIKYQQRGGWSHRDLLRLSHPHATTPEHDLVFSWIVDGWPDPERVTVVVHPDAFDGRIWAFEKAKSAITKEIVRLIRDYDLPREAIPTEHLTSPLVWEALLERMPMEAMVRNLATMTRVGLLLPNSDAVQQVIDRLSTQERISKSRIHPIKVLAALLTYRSGHGAKSKGEWSPVSQIVDALDGAFYTSFGNVTSTGKRWLLALDVSGSMNSGEVAGVPGLTPRVAAAAMAMITARTEARHHIVGFWAGGNGWVDPSGRSRWSGSNGLTPLPISPRQRLDDVCALTNGLPFGGTDCALPMLYATERKLDVDAFVIYTDSETWAGGIHPIQALQQYRQKIGIPAKLVVVGMASNGFTIASPDDAGSMDVCGFDTATPQLISDFVVQGVGADLDR